MDDLFQPGKISGVDGKVFGEPGPVDTAIDDDVGKSRGDGQHPGAASIIEPVDDRIGVGNRDAFRGEHPRRFSLAHADRTGEADHDHRLSPGSISRATRSWSSAVTSGRLPNHNSNPRTAWCSSIPRP